MKLVYKKKSESFLPKLANKDYESLSLAAALPAYRDTLRVASCYDTKEFGVWTQYCLRNQSKIKG